MKTLPIGPIANNLQSHAQTLIVCLAVLSDLDATCANRHKEKSIVKKIESGDELSLLDRYQLGRAVSAIMSDIKRHIPPFSYLGYRPNDPFSLGVWVDIGALHAAEQNGKLTQIAGGPWRGVQSTYVLDMGTNGLTLYRRRGKKAIWTTN